MNASVMLFVPARKKMLDKIVSFTADAYVVDLEDSISEKDKDLALEEAKTWFEHSENCNGSKYVRLDNNVINKQIHELKDIADGFLIPKAESVDEIEVVKKKIGDKFLMALIETPLGVVVAESLARSSCVDAIVFGAEDYCSSIGMRRSNDNLLYVRSRLINAARAYGKLVYDTPSFEISNMEKLREECAWAYSLGFDGKMAIHPQQVPVVSSVFGNEDVEVIKEIVERYDAEGQAVLRIGDRVYEKMHIARMRRILSNQH